MVYIKKFKVFVPSEEAPQPDVKFVPMLTRRRLSLLSKMVVFVNDAVSKDLPPCKVTFASQYGEISQQLKISDTLLQTGNVSPAHFSLSPTPPDIQPCFREGTPSVMGFPTALPHWNPVPKKNVFLSSPTKKFQKHTLPWQEFLTPTPTAPWP